MGIPIVRVCDASEALLACGVPNLKLHLDAVDCDYLVLWTDGASWFKCLLKGRAGRYLFLKKYIRVK